MIGETQGKTHFVTTVVPGPHYVVVATENTCVAQFDFKPGKTYLLGRRVAMGAWRARSAGLYPLTPEEAAKAMKSCTYLEYEPRAGGEKMDAGLFRQAINEHLQHVRKNPGAFADVLQYDGVVLK